jgi:serine phosphatase RsbU (regulator of sigma subunit)
MPDEKVLVIIGDVTGHGVASAMVSAAAQGTATSLITDRLGDFDLRLLLKTMNSVIFKTANGRFLMTCFAYIYDPKARKLFFANAGHNFPFFCHAETQKLSALVVRGNRLGDVRHSEYTVEEIEAQPNDTIFLYTDGIIECENPEGRMFGERRFRQLIREYSKLPMDVARDSLIHSALTFYDSIPPKDDITLVVGRFS